MKRVITFLFMLIFLTACQAPELKIFSLNTYQAETPIALNVKKIDVISTVERFDRLPHIEDDMPVSPETALKKWALNRFYASQNKKVDIAQFTIEKAYMTKKEDKSENWYTFDNEAYKLTYFVRVDFIKNGRVIYTQDVGGFESSSLPVRSSLADKEAVFEKMMNQMIKKVNNQILSQMPNEFIL